MPADSGSILRKLQGGFAMAATILAMGMSLFMDHSLRQSLETEDAQVMASQAKALMEQLPQPGLAEVRGEAPLEKAEWRLVDGAGNTVRESPGMGRLPHFDWPSPGATRELESPRGTFSLRSQAIQLPGGADGRLLMAMDRTHEEALIAGFRRTLALGVAVSAVFAALLGRWIAAWGLAPLRQIARQAADINDKNLAQRLNAAHFPLELQELVSTLNAALARLEDSFQRLEHLGAELAHELRTPLQNLRSTVENALLSSDPAPVTPAFLGGLLEDCDQLGALIEQILFLAKSGDGQNNVAMEPLSALELLEETRAFFEAAAEERNVTLQVVSEIEVSFQGNRLLLLRAFHNLVSNALKHTRETGCVQLGARAELERVCLWVQDDGNGIPSNWIARLGTPFLKGPSPASRDGLGLGLAIVRRVAHLHGGEMQIQSAVGQGTRVELHLPRLCRL